MEDKPETTTPVENEKRWTIEFKYNNKDFKIENRFPSIAIEDVNGFEEGTISGHYVQLKDTAEVVFEVNKVSNKGVVGAEEGPPVFTSGHTKYLIAEAITQIILSGKVDRWVSSEGTNSGSDKMYMHIEEEGRVKVKTIQSIESGQFHYEITRKDQESTEKI